MHQRQQPNNVETCIRLDNQLNKFIKSYLQNLNLLTGQTVQTLISNYELYGQHNIDFKKIFDEE